jgi:hypothetical protein
VRGRGFEPRMAFASGSLNWVLSPPPSTSSGTPAGHLVNYFITYKTLSYIFFNTRDVRVDETPFTDLIFSMVLLSSTESLASTFAIMS